MMQREVLSSACLSTTSSHSDQQVLVGSRKVKRTSTGGQMKTVRLFAILSCSLCLLGIFLPARQVQCGRLQDFIQNLVGGGNGNSNSNGNSQSSSSSSNSNSNSNSNSEGSDSDTAASGENNDQQPMTPMMSAMNPFMRYPSFYDSFASASYGGYPGMSFTNPMGAMSGLSPMAMSSQSLGSAFSPASFSPASFGSFGSPGAGLGSFGGANAMSAPSSLSNVFAASSPGMMGGFAPYYGRRK